MTRTKVGTYSPCPWRLRQNLEKVIIVEGTTYKKYIVLVSMKLD